MSESNQKKKKDPLEIYLTLLWLATGLFLLCGPYNTGLLGLFFWMIMGATLSDMIKNYDRKDN